MKPKKPQVRYVLYGGCLGASGVIGLIFDFMPPFAVWQALFYGSLIFVPALFCYRFEWKRYRAHRATPPSDEEPAP